jgi:hypothetical protein
LKTYPEIQRSPYRFAGCLLLAPTSNHKELLMDKNRRKQEKNIKKLAKFFVIEAKAQMI